MKRIVWTFGLIAGAIMAAMIFITMAFQDQIGTDKGEIIGYTTMILAFLMVYFGIRSYRDNVMAGTIGFGRAFKVGILITLVASACYVAAWELVLHTLAPDFAEKYAALIVEKARADGASAAQIEAKQKEMAQFAENYKNPVISVGMTFVEVFPIGVVVVLVSAGVLSRKREAKLANL
jgi:hypothetical protein